MGETATVGADDASEERTLSPEEIGLAIYALITASVVLAGADEYAPFYIAALMVAQGFSLMLAHGYAESVAHQTSLRSGLVHAIPVILVALPSAAIALLLGVLGFEGETVVYTGEAFNLAALVALQGYATRRAGFSWARLAGAIALDVVAIVTVVGIVAFLK